MVVSVLSRRMREDQKQLTKSKSINSISRQIKIRKLHISKLILSPKIQLSQWALRFWFKRFHGESNHNLRILLSKIWAKEIENIIIKTFSEAMIDIIFALLGIPSFMRSFVVYSRTSLIVSNQGSEAGFLGRVPQWWMRNASDPNVT